jgi:hypothetical protein
MSETPVTWEDVKKARVHGDKTPEACGDMTFDWWLANINGAGFLLFREPRHTDEDVEKAKAFLKRERDVVGRIRVTQVVGDPPKERKNYVVLYRTSDLKPADPPLGFQCWAEDTEPAEEQCTAAHPGCDIVWVWEGEFGSGIEAALEDYYSTGL